MNSSVKDSIHNAIAALERAATKRRFDSAFLDICDAMAELDAIASIQESSKRCKPKRRRAKLIIMPKPANPNPDHPEGPGAA